MSDAREVGRTTGDGGLDRRSFLGVVPLAAAALAGLRQAGFPAARASSPGPLNAIGVQLYTVRQFMARDVEGALAAIAEIGFREVELWRLHGLTALEMRAVLDGLELEAVSSHDSLDVIRGEWSRRLDEAVQLGQTYLVCPSIPHDERTLDGYRRIADDFNVAGEAAHAMGMRLGYHNHDHEFAAIDGVVPYDLLLERCDPRFVDMPAAIFARAEQAGIRHAFVEHDRPNDPMESVRVGFN